MQKSHDWSVTFTPDWLKKWGDFFSTNRRASKVKPRKRNYVPCSIENRSMKKLRYETSWTAFDQKETPVIESAHRFVWGNSDLQVGLTRLSHTDVIYKASFSTFHQQGGRRALRTCLFWNSKVVLVLNLVLVVWSEGHLCRMLGSQKYYSLTSYLSI